MIRFALNPSQESVVQDAVNFVKYSSEQVFQIAGLPGTGKSVVLNEIQCRLIDEGIIMPSEVLAMAYTGQAAIVMRTKGFPEARTIHSSLYTPETDVKVDKSTNLPVMNTKYNVPVTNVKFSSVPRIPGKSIMFIDEGRMVPLSMKKDIEKYGMKIIVAGDPGQLGPIADDPAYLVDGKIHYLTQLMRQAENSGIVYIANRCTRGLPIHKGFYGNCLVIDRDELNDEMIMAANIIICGKNKTREEMNNRVRKDILHITSDIPTVGDRVICRKNNWKEEMCGISLANGLNGTCVSMPNLAAFDGNVFTMDFLPDLLNVPFMNLTCDYKYYIAPYELKQEIKNNKYSMGNKFDLAYALTTHLAQGSEYSNGIYIEERLGDGSMSNNLNNTGITRFRKAAIYVKEKIKRYW